MGHAESEMMAIREQYIKIILEIFFERSQVCTKTLIFSTMLWRSTCTRLPFRFYQGLDCFNRDIHMFAFRLYFNLLHIFKIFRMVYRKLVQSRNTVSGFFETSLSTSVTPDHLLTDLITTLINTTFNKSCNIGGSKTPSKPNLIRYR